MVFPYAFYTFVTLIITDFIKEIVVFWMGYETWISNKAHQLSSTKFTGRSDK